jgi:hypothetical protein
MADFISLHKEEWVALISGLEFSAMVANAKILFIPVVIVILGLSLLIWLYRLEREKAWNDFILWLIFSSIVIISAFKTQKVVVELNPVVLNSNSMLLNPNVDEKKLEADEKNLIFRYKADASGISALLAIPDKIAALVFNFMDARLLKKLAGVSNTMTLDNVACQDPRYLAGLIHTLVLSEVFSLTEGSKQKFEDFNEKVRAFEECYRNDFKGKLSRRLSFNFDGEKLRRAIAQGVVAGGAVGSNFTSLGGVVGAVVGGAAGLLKGVVAMVELTPGADCNVFVKNGYEKLADQVAERCAAILGGKYNKNVIVNAVLACITSPETLLSGEFAGPYRMSAGSCVLLKRKTLDTIEYVKQEMDRLMNIGRSGWWGSLKDDAARAVSDAKDWWFSTTYMDFPLKFDLLAKGQGIVLALLTGMFPFVAVLSVIPTGRSFMNWSLLLNFMIAYFMVKMWIPLLFFIVNVAAHKLGAFAVGG